MSAVNPWAVVAATAAAFVISLGWYALVAAAPVAADGGETPASASPPAWKLLVEVARSLVVAIVLAVLAAQLDVGGITGALLIGVVAWVGFPVVLLAGSVLWEGVPASRAAVHAGDWLVKLLAVAVIVSLWR